MKKIRIKQLAQKPVDELLVYSLDQSLYTVKAVVEGQYFQIIKGLKPYRAFSMGQIHRDFALCDFKRITLIQESAYDEMIGQPIKASPNTLNISSPVNVDVYKVQ